MMDFMGSDLLLQTLTAQREREALAVSRASALDPVPRGLRAMIAARLAGIALRLDRDTTGSLVARDFRAAGRRG
jgi:hypothetical protein